ncbi:hypothetical protein XELAEV_18005586mg [Xenopus laevis]|uniref:GIY-YIG domain-containing protein n=1 Tax=Xenopus laevis TaxID=8355 RepID=A0A974DYH0_XENLA|nr:hypothetical protein XELAEV_18005586mg [Xenopus laevis]
MFALAPHLSKFPNVPTLVRLETGCNYRLKGHFTCLSKFVVYGLVCPCGLIYVGQTTLQIKTRISQHRSTIRRSNTKLPVSKHYVEKGHSDSELELMVLEEVFPLRRGGGCELLLRKR